MNNEEVQEDDIIKPLIKDVITPPLLPDPLEACLNPAEDMKKNEKIGEISSLLILAPLISTDRWQSHSKKLPQPHNCPFPSKIQSPNHKPKPLLAKLKNAYLGLLHFLYYSLYIFCFLY